MATKASLSQIIADTKAKVLKLQQDRKASGLTAEEEAQLEVELADLSVTADPAVDNPQGTAPDPNLR